MAQWFGHAGLEIWQSQIQVLPWQWAGFVLGSLWFNSLGALENSPLVFLPPDGILNLFSLFVEICCNFLYGWSTSAHDYQWSSSSRTYQIKCYYYYCGEQCWHSDESTGLPAMWPGFDSRIGRHLWVEFVGSLLCSKRFFPGHSGFLISPNTNIWFNMTALS